MQSVGGKFFILAKFRYYVLGIRIVVVLGVFVGGMVLLDFAYLLVIRCFKLFNLRGVYGFGVLVDFERFAFFFRAVC